MYLSFYLFVLTNIVSQPNADYLIGRFVFVDLKILYEVGIIIIITSLMEGSSLKEHSPLHSQITCDLLRALPTGFYAICELEKS